MFTSTAARWLTGKGARVAIDVLMPFQLHTTTALVADASGELAKSPSEVLYPPKDAGVRA